MSDGKVHVDTSAQAARLARNVTRGGTSGAEPDCAGCVALRADVARLRLAVARLRGENERLHDLLGARGSHD